MIPIRAPRHALADTRGVATEDWTIAQHREKVRRELTAQRRAGWRDGWYAERQPAATATAAPSAHARLPLSKNTLEQTLLSQPGHAMTMSALAAVFQPSSKAEQRGLARLVADACTIGRLPGRGDLVMLKKERSSRPSSPAKGGGAGKVGPLEGFPAQIVQPGTPGRPRARSAAAVETAATPMERFLLESLSRDAAGGDGLLPLQHVSELFADADEPTRRRLALVLSEVGRIEQIEGLGACLELVAGAAARHREAAAPSPSVVVAGAAASAPPTSTETSAR